MASSSVPTMMASKMFTRTGLHGSLLASSPSARRCGRSVLNRPLLWVRTDGSFLQSDESVGHIVDCLASALAARSIADNLDDAQDVSAVGRSFLERHGF